MSLEFRHIAHAYGPVRALEDVSFTAPAGEITCLLGASGCGKSTLLGLAAGLLSVQQGEIVLGGELLADAHRSPPPEARPVGLTTIQDSVILGCDALGDFLFVASWRRLKCNQIPDINQSRPLDRFNPRRFP